MAPRPAPTRYIAVFVKSEYTIWRGWTPKLSRYPLKSGAYAYMLNTRGMPILRCSRFFTSASRRRAAGAADQLQIVENLRGKHAAERALQWFAGRAEEHQQVEAEHRGGQDERHRHERFGNRLAGERPSTARCGVGPFAPV